MLVIVGLKTSSGHKMRPSHKKVTFGTEDIQKVRTYYVY